MTSTLLIAHRSLLIVHWRGLKGTEGTQSTMSNEPHEPALRVGAGSCPNHAVPVQSAIRNPQSAIEDFPLAIGLIALA